MSWKELETQIRSQVENGTYMSANEVYLVDEAERGRIANHLYFFSVTVWRKCRKNWN